VNIGQLAREAGVPIDTVRYYERNGLLPTPARRASGYRDYPQGDVERLRFVRRAKTRGFHWIYNRLTNFPLVQPEHDQRRTAHLDGSIAINPVIGGQADPGQGVRAGSAASSCNRSPGGLASPP
jgi:hypothetical protein